MYRIAQKTLKLDGVITEFADIYAPVAQMLMTESENEAKQSTLISMTNIRR